MTAIRYNKLWIKLLIVLLLAVLGIAGIYFAYETQETQPLDPEERIEEEEVIPGPETAYNRIEKKRPRPYPAVGHCL